MNDTHKKIHMKISRRNFLKKGLAGTLFLGTATLPQPLQALTTKAFAAAPKEPNVSY